MQQSWKMEQVALRASVLMGNSAAEAAALRELDGESAAVRWAEAMAEHPRLSGSAGPVRR